MLRCNNAHGICGGAPRKRRTGGGGTMSLPTMAYRPRRTARPAASISESQALQCAPPAPSIRRGCDPQCGCQRGYQGRWRMDRRRFFGLSAAAGGMLAADARNWQAFAQPSGPAYGGAPKLDVQTPLTQQQQFRIGYTTN